MSDSNYLFITQVMPHEDTDDHEVVARCGNLDIMHAPGEIQSFGAMIGVKEPELTMQYVSENTIGIIGTSYDQLLGKHLSQLLGEEEFKKVESKLANQNFKMINPITVTVNGKMVDLILHRRSDVLFIEIEPVQANQGDINVYRQLSQNAIMKILQATTVPELVQVACDSIREITNYDRVLFYTFDEQYHGKVIGESRVPDIDSFLGHRFPAWETPSTVRELYRTNFTRYLPHIFDVPVKALAADGEPTEGRLDMTNTILRATRQCHTEYLTNMGIASSLTFSMTMNERIWGFILCHKKRPGVIPYTHRLVCEQLVSAIPDELWSREQPEKYEQKLIALKDQALNETRQAPNIASGLLSQYRNLLEMTRADGGALFFNNIIKTYGTAPSDEQVRQLINLLANGNSNLVFQSHPAGLLYTNNLTNHLKKFGLMSQTDFTKSIKDVVSGVLIVPITNSSNDFILWFRQEQVTVATWAGNPSKDTIFDEKYMHAPLNPRKSFDSWKENVVNRSEAWLPMEIKAATQLRDGLLA